MHGPVRGSGAGGGPALLGHGFRPFFLGAGLAAVVDLALWVADISGLIALPTAFAPQAWHAHEMLFGFTTAAVAGFLLTAAPNWTGRPPLHGGPLLALVLLWLIGRIASTMSGMIGAWPAAVVDVSFLAALAAVIGREIIAGKTWRNLPMIAALAALLAANALMHAEALGVLFLAGEGWRLAVAVVTLLIVLIGGRIVPNFTRNWLVLHGDGPLPKPFGLIDRLALGGTVTALCVWVVFPGTGEAAVLTGLAAILNALRLARWQGHRTLADPLVFVLHLGYAWVSIGLALLAYAQATLGFAEATAAHGLTAGAIGTMTLAVMTRATLGHTGRALRASAATQAVYVLVSIAAAARLMTVAWPAAYDFLVWTSAAAWIAAFAGFLAAYGPMLIGPRIDGRAG